MSNKPSALHCITCESRAENVLFCNLPKEALEIIDQAKSENRYARGQTVFYAGNMAPGLYCVTKGVIKVEATGSSGTSHILRMVGPGGILGYRSLFAEEPYQSTATVNEDAKICFIPKSSLLELIAKQPQVAMNLLKHVSRELRMAEDRMRGRVDKDASERVAESLLFLKDHFEEQVWTRREIAEWAGTTPETVMRTLANFEEEGFVEQQGRKIKVLDRKALLKIAQIDV